MRRIFVRNSLSYLLGRPLVESKVGHGYSRTPLLKLESRLVTKMYGNEPVEIGENSC